MYQFKDNPSAEFYHEQRFTLTWDFPASKRVLVRYYNGNRRVILPIITNSKIQVNDGSRYKLVNWFLWLFRKKRRSHRFKRHFLRKPQDEFVNIANYRSQQIDLFIFKTQFPFIQKIRIPMRVKLLRVEENKMNVNVSEVQTTSFQAVLTGIHSTIFIPAMNVQEKECNPNIPESNFDFNVEIKESELDYSINDLINSGKISNQTTNESIFQLIK